MPLDDVELKKLIEDGNKVITSLRSEVDGIKAADVVKTEKIGRMEAELAANLAAKQAADLSAKALETRLADMETKMARPNGLPKPGDEAATEYKEAFLNFVRHPQDPSAGQKLYDLNRKAADVRTSTVGSGGYALPEQIATDIAKQVQDMSPIRSIARVVQVGTPDYKELVDLNGFGFEWVGETTTRNQTNTPNLGEVAPTFGSIVAKPEATVESLEDLFFNVEDWLMRSATEQFAIGEGIAFVSGNGTNKPTGFLAGPTPVATSDASRAFGTLQYLPTGQAAALATNAYDSFQDLALLLKAGYRPGSRWVMNSITMAALAKVKDAEGRFMLNASVADGLPDRILGYGITIAEDMPVIAANAFPVAFGDFSRGYLIADRVGMSAVRDEVTKPGYLKFILRKRVGGLLKDTAAIKLLKISIT
jgi:HK97 family phage major capsid protein